MIPVFANHLMKTTPSLVLRLRRNRSFFVKWPGGFSIRLSALLFKNPNQPRKDHIMSPDTSSAPSRTPYRLVITVCLVFASLGCMRTTDKFCGVDRETLKQNLIRLVESPVIKDDDWVNATSITIDNVEPLPLSDGKADVSFVVRWTSGVGDARTEHSGNWQANLQKAGDGHCHVMGVAVRSGDTWIKAINTDFEIK